MVVGAAAGLIGGLLGCGGPSSPGGGVVDAAERNEALIAAAWDNDVEAARRLIEAGADVNHQDGSRQSAYLIATSEGHLDLLELTLANGADVTALDSFNGTGLIRAAEQGPRRRRRTPCWKPTSRSTTSTTSDGPPCTRRSSSATAPPATFAPWHSSSTTAPTPGSSPATGTGRSTSASNRGQTAVVELLEDAAG